MGQNTSREIQNKLTGSSEARRCRCLHGLPPVVPVFRETVDNCGFRCRLFLFLLSVIQTHTISQAAALKAKAEEMPGLYVRTFLATPWASPTGTPPSCSCSNISFQMS